METITLETIVKLDEKGHEIPDPNPVAMPAGFKHPESLQNQIQRLVRGQISEAADAAGFETFEDAEDFDVDDEIDVDSPYEMEFDPTLGRDISPQMIRDDPERYRTDFVRNALNDEESETLVQRVKNKWRPNAKKPAEPAPEPEKPVAST